VYNRGVEKRLIFSDIRSNQRFREICEYYLYDSPQIRYSQFMNLATEPREQCLKALKLKPRIISIICYTCMPNHFHFLIRQEGANGISQYMRHICDSYTRYFNTRHKRVGPLFQGQFKAIHIDTNDQLLHLSRYIHLNPYTSRLVTSFPHLLTYPWSSLKDYFENETQFIDARPVLSSFRTPEKYQAFLKDRADYQRRLHSIEDVLIEKPARIF